MLPAKIGEGVFGSNSGGVKPTGASSFAGVSVAAAFPSAAEALIVLEAVFGNLSGFGVTKEEEIDCFHGTTTRSLVLEAERVGVKRVVAWHAMVGEDERISGWLIWVIDYFFPLAKRSG